MRIGGVDLVATVKGVAKETVTDDVTGMAAELSYRFFLALFPFAIMLAALSGFAAAAFGIKNPHERIVDQFSSTLPPDTASVLERQIGEVVEGGDFGLVSIGLLGALWAASSGVGALIKALNRAYDVPETRPFWKRTLLAVGLTVTGGAAMIGAFVVMVGAGAWGEDIAGWFGADRAFELTITVVRWPLAVLLLMCSVALLYYLAPNIEQKFRFISPGAVIFTIAWLAATFLFSIYVGNFSSYNATYGALGGIVVLLLWFYLSSVVLLIGAEINAMIDAQLDPDAVEDRRQKVIQARREAPPTPQEEFERDVHGKQPLRPATEEGGTGLRGPALAALGLVAAFFAARRFAR